MKSTSYICDAPNCGKQRGEKNHWLLVACGDGLRSFTTNPWTDGEADSGNYKHICSVDCAISIYRHWLESIRLSAVKEKSNA